MSHPLLNAFWMIFWFFLWVMWLMLLFRVIADLFGDRALSGWAKAGWVIFVCLLPYLGVLVYLITRGAGMTERTMRRVEADRQVIDDYIRDTAGSAGGGNSSVDELSRLADLKATGALTEEEFQQAKHKILA